MIRIANVYQTIARRPLLIALGLTSNLLLTTGCEQKTTSLPNPVAGAAMADAVSSDLIAAPALTTSSWTLESSSR